MNDLEKMRLRISRLEAENTRLNKSLSYAEREKKIILNSLVEHVIYHDLDLRVLWANRAACESAGTALDKLVGRHCYEIWSKRSDSCKDCPVQLSRDTGQPHALEKKTPDGRSWQIHAFPVNNTRGEITGIIELTLEITEQKRAEKALKESRKRYQTLVETATHGIQETDISGTITFSNSAHNAIFGYDGETMIGLSILDLQVSDSTRADLEAYLETVTQSQPQPTPYITKNLTKDGKFIDVQVDWDYKRDDQNHVIGFISVVTDITGKKREEAALEKAIDTLELHVEERAAELLETNTQLKRKIEEHKRTEEALGEQKDFLNTLLETISSPVFYKNVDGRYAECNRAFEEFIGKSRADIIGKTVYDLGPKEIADKYHEKDSELIKKPGKQRYEWKVKNANGVLRDVIFDKATLKNTDGSVAGLVGIISDITDLKRSEQELRAREETLKAILAASPIGIYLARNRILEWTNQAMYRICGYETDSLLGRSIRMLYSDTEEYEHVDRGFYSTIEKNGIGRIETQWVTRKGKNIHCYLQGCQLDPSDPSKGIIVAATDITERKHAEDLVRNLSQMLIKTQETERQMISYELHDSIAQSLSSLKIDCDTFFDNQPTISLELKKKIAKQSELIAQVIRAVRELSYGLHPPSLDQIGITQALSQLCDDFTEEAGLTVEFTPTGMAGLRPDQTLGINLYRLVQEGLNNVRKHAAAAHVTVSLVASHPNVILRIEDDGKGFDVQAREAALDRKKKLGLRSMAERVGLLQGKMKIKSAPMKGTKILIKIPFKKDKENGES